MSEQSASISLPKPGDLIAGKYRVEKLIGQGGMGAVFSAQHEILLQKVAVKVLLGEVAQSQEAISRFLNEARNAARIQGEHVCRVTDCGAEGGLPFMVLEFMDGQDLAQVLESRGRLGTEEAVDYVLQSLEAIHQAHQLGIVHRDLKPSNLFLHRRPDGSSIVKVLDFGISKAQTSLGAAPGALTSTKAMLGSPLYMSPEQLRSSKSVDQRADIWALGVILYELLTGSVPYMGENLGELFAAILETDPVPLRSRVPDVPPALEAVVMSCLQRQAQSRTPNVQELARGLAPFSSARSSNLSLVMNARATGHSPYAATNLPTQREPMPSYSGASQTGRTGATSDPRLPPRGASTVSAVNLPAGSATPRYGATTPMPGLMQAPQGASTTGGSGAIVVPKRSAAPFVVIGVVGLLLLGGGAAYAFKRLRSQGADSIPVAAAGGSTSDLTIATNSAPVAQPPGSAAPPSASASGAASGNAANVTAGATAANAPSNAPSNATDVAAARRAGAGNGRASSNAGGVGVVTAQGGAAGGAPPGLPPSLPTMATGPQQIVPVVTQAPPAPPPPAPPPPHPAPATSKPADVFGGRN